MGRRPMPPASTVVGSHSQLSTEGWEFFGVRQSPSFRQHPLSRLFPPHFYGTHTTSSPLQLPLYPFCSNCHGHWHCGESRGCRDALPRCRGRCLVRGCCLGTPGIRCT